jgi:hypothetical protein
VLGVLAERKEMLGGHGRERTDACLEARLRHRLPSFQPPFEQGQFGKYALAAFQGTRGEGTHTTAWNISKLDWASGGCRGFC